MTAFEAIITESKTARSPETDLILKRVRDGSESERQAALEQLQQQAREQGSLDAWNRVGIGLHLAGLNTEAIRIFEGLVREAPGQRRVSSEPRNRLFNNGADRALPLPSAPLG